jgi:hypothetical protein
MISRNPIQDFLLANRALWDHPGTRPAARKNFQKMIDCRTAALGMEVYASATEEKFVFHTCKSRACPICGNRARLVWQDQIAASLPDIPYVGIGFTMPKELWPIFQVNRHLLHDLPAIAAAVIQGWVKRNYGARVLLLVIPHTFGAHLNFNCHLHILASASGLKESKGKWIELSYRKHPLMMMWKYAVITYLREALNANILTYHLSPESLKQLLTAQYERDFWITKVATLLSKYSFLMYIARYLRRPPIAPRRITQITDRVVRFNTKDKKLGQVTTEYSLADFVQKLADQVPDEYRHQPRYFGLLAPNTQARTSAAVMFLLGQKKRSRPQNPCWRSLIRRWYGRDPLLDSRNQQMYWLRREKPRLNA